MIIDFELEKKLKLCSNVKNNSMSRLFCESAAKRVLVVANMSAGKSTLINGITGYRVNAVGNTACTRKLKFIFNKPIEEGFSVWNRNRQEIEHYKKDSDLFGKECDAVAFHFNSILQDKNICFIDTPGVNNINYKLHEKITYNAIAGNEYDLLLFVADGRYLGTTDEKNTLDYLIAKTTKPIIVAINQLDLYDPKQDSIEKTLNTYKKMMKDQHLADIDVFPVTGWLAFMEKTPDDKQDVRDVREENFTRKLFDDDFYDLQQYVTKRHTDKIIDKTGVPLLEQTIAIKLFGYK